jgi:hypothetical protein
VPRNRRESSITGRAYASETSECSPACSADIKHCCEEYKEPDKIHERNEENVLWLAGKPRTIAHICLLSPRLGLGRQNFNSWQAYPWLTGLASTLFTVGGGAITLERGFDFYLLFYLLWADFGLVTGYRNSASCHLFRRRYFTIE